MNKLTPLVKGLITSAAMLALTMFLYYSKQPGDSGFQYLFYLLFAGGIGWTLYDYSRSAGYTGKFGDIFGQGFRCFIVVTLVMVAFTGIFNKMHPEFAAESAKYYREDLVKAKNTLPKDIDTEVSEYQKQFTTRLVSASIFRYLIIGSVFTAAGAGILLMRRR